MAPRKIRKIQRVMPILGTFIVLLTYIGKEHFKENWKDTAAQIDMAHYFYSVLVDTTAEESRYRSTHLQLARTQELILAHGTPMFRPEDIVRYNIEALDIDNDQIGAELETLNVIIEKLPEKDENKKTLDELIGRSDRLRKAQIDAVDIQPPESLPLDHDKFWQAYDEACERAIQRQSDLQKEFNTFDSEVLAFSKKVVHHADDLRKENEVKARIADRTSLVLYTLGLFLGLLGKFYGWEFAEAD